jgi:hypothetical protein
MEKPWKGLLAFLVLQVPLARCFILAAKLFHDVVGGSELGHTISEFVSIRKLFIRTVVHFFGL